MLISYIDFYLRINDKNGQFRDNQKAQLFGVILYEDFRKLTSEF